MLSGTSLDPSELRYVFKMVKKLKVFHDAVKDPQKTLMNIDILNAMKLKMDLTALCKAIAKQLVW